MLTKRFLIPLVLALAVFGAPTGAAAQSPTWSADDLAGFSSVIATGRVLGHTTAWDPAVRGIYTYVTVDVADVWKGPIAPGHIVLKILGGRVGNLELHIEGQATLAPGSDVLLWLEVRPRDGTLYPTALAQGIWNIESSRVQEFNSSRVQGSRVQGSRVQGFAVQRFNGSEVQRASLSDLRSLAETSAIPLSRAITIWPQELSAAADFTLLPSSEGGPARWHESDAGLPINVDYEAPPSGLGGGVAEIVAAFQLWNSTGMALRLQQGQTRTPRCLAAFDGDGRISVAFNDPCGEISDSGSILGLGGGYFTPGDTRTINGVAFKKFLQGNVVLNNSAGAFTFLSQRGCFQDAITHNLGHAIGLGDATSTNAIMWRDPQPTCTTRPSLAAADDINGAKFIYPSGITTGLPGAPSNFTATVVGTTVTLSWTPAVTGGTPTQWVIEGGSGPGLANLVIVLLPVTTTTSVTFNGVAPGFYYARLKARNEFGTSAASNEIQVAVACPAPLPPTNLAFTRSGNVVTFTWNAPASGSVLGYRATVGSAPGLENLLLTDIPPITSGSATGPAGTFYVHLRTRGTCGFSAPSNEVTVVIP
jgi:hypothetical protein